MMRLLLIAFISTTLTIAAGETAQTPAKTAFPLEFAGGTHGVSIEIFLNAGKVGDVPLDASGGGNWLLDMGNQGKTQVTVYIDVCKDGKVVKVAFVTAGGQAPPRDESCDSRVVAVTFRSDCGVTRITFNLLNRDAKAVGCGWSFTDPKVVGGIVGTALIPVLITAGGGDTTAPTGVSSTPPTTSGPPVTTPPTTAVPPSTMPPSTPPPTTTPPSTPPAPAPNLIDQLMGTYVIRSCVCELDQGGHDQFLRLCQQLRQLRFTRNGTTNSVRIDGESPFIASEFMLDANTRAIDGNARGSAGSVSALVRYAGEFAPPPAFVVNLSLTYTINGTDIRYRVSAAKP